MCADSTKREKVKSKNKEPAPEDAYVAYWNRHCAPLGTVIDFTAELRDQLRARISAGLTPQKFAKLLRKALVTPNLMGKMKSGWMVDFAYVVESDENIAKILNGGFGKEERSPIYTVEHWSRGLRGKQEGMFHLGEKAYLEGLIGGRDKAKVLEEPERAKEFARIDAEEADTRKFFEFVARMRSEDAETAAADDAFLAEPGIATDTKPPKAIGGRDANA